MLGTCVYFISKVFNVELFINKSSTEFEVDLDCNVQNICVMCGIS